MKEGSNRALVGAILTGTLLVSGFMLALSITPKMVPGKAIPPQQTGTGNYGRLLVGVSIEDPNGSTTPVEGVQVGISQLIIHGIRFSFQTNGTGEVEFVLQPGDYGVTLTERRLGVKTQVTIHTGMITDLKVGVNKTEYLTGFADLSASTGAPTVNVWETMELEVRYQLLPRSMPVIIGNSTVVLPSLVDAVPALGENVFIQAFSFINPYLSFPKAGAEVEAHVLSQTNRSGGLWVELQPYEPFPLADAGTIALINYVPGYSVSYSNATGI